METKELGELDEVRVAKLAWLGLHAAGLIHELNNPLHAILANLQVLDEYREAIVGFINLVGKSRVEPEDNEILKRFRSEHDLEYMLTDVGKLLESCKMVSHRALETIQTMRRISTGEETLLKQVDLDEFVASGITFIKELDNRNRIIEHKRAFETIELILDRGRADQVLCNVLLNACQAVRNNDGKIKVTVEKRVGGGAVVVEDGGIGMTSEVLERVFEPFFSTGKAGGTGLGLYLAKRFMQDIGGHLELCSSPGKGTTVTLIFPEQLVEGK